MFCNFNNIESLMQWYSFARYMQKTLRVALIKVEGLCLEKKNINTSSESSSGFNSPLTIFFFIKQKWKQSILTIFMKRYFFKCSPQHGNFKVKCSPWSKVNQTVLEYCSDSHAPQFSGPENVVFEKLCLKVQSNTYSHFICFTWCMDLSKFICFAVQGRNDECPVLIHIQIHIYSSVFLYTEITISGVLDAKQNQKINCV